MKTRKTKTMKDRFIKIVFDMKSFSMEMVLGARIVFFGRPLILASHL